MPGHIFAGNTEICCELLENDVGLAWQLSPHDPSPPNSRGGFNIYIYIYIPRLARHPHMLIA